MLGIFANYHDATLALDNPHFSHMGFTDGLTFILFNLHMRTMSLVYLLLQVIRP